jgi:predicted phosphodiesterase
VTCTHLKHHAAKACRDCYEKSRAKRPETLEAFEDNGATATLTKRSEDVRTLAQLLAACQVDLDTWEVERHVANKWGDGLFQVKAWLRRRVAVQSARDTIDALVAAAKQRIPARPTVKRREGNHLLEVNIPDLHLGKLAWSKETGYGDYDTKLAEQVFEAAIERLLERVSGFAFSRVLFPIGSDFLNIDNKGAMTTGGTPQDVDSRYPKIYVAGRVLLCRAIERFRRVAPVHVVVVGGNHDSISSFTLGDAIECFFHNTADVTVDNGPTQRKYYEFGQTLLMLTHGDKGKHADYPLLMAAEQPQAWGRTRFHEIHLGHLHQTRVQEKNGVRVRILSALCEPDAWHSANGYVGNHRGAEAFVFHETDGLVAQAYYTA